MRIDQADAHTVRAVVRTARARRSSPWHKACKWRRCARVKPVDQLLLAALSDGEINEVEELVGRDVIPFSAEIEIA